MMTPAEPSVSETPADPAGAPSTAAPSRVDIGCNFRRLPLWRIAIAIPLIYLPILTLAPFAAVTAVIIYWHLRLLGGKGIKTYSEFVPEWVTHRYTYANQITMRSRHGAFWLGSKVFWIFNCKLYCPLSVALFSWICYLVKLVENWWCPFGHAKKNAYAVASIDQSFWHMDDRDAAKLHEDDRHNPIWSSGYPPKPPQT